MNSSGLTINSCSGHQSHARSTTNLKRNVEKGSITHGKDFDRFLRSIEKAFVICNCLLV